MKLSALLISFLFFGIVSSEEPGYVFGWTHLADPDLQTPIGGSTIGPEIEMDEDPNSYWLELQSPGLSKYEKDRLAILGMQEVIRQILILWKRWVSQKLTHLQDPINLGEQNL